MDAVSVQELAIDLQASLGKNLFHLFDMHALKYSYM